MRKPKKIKEVKIAFGLLDNMFIYDSTGFTIEHPEFYTSDLPRLAYLNQKLARRTKWYCPECKQTNNNYKTLWRGKKKKSVCINCDSRDIIMDRSDNGWKAKHTLSKWHEHIERKRDYFLWHLARMYAENFETVIVQKWPLKKEIQYAVNNKTAKRLCDGAYGKFIHHLKFKCEELGTEFIERKDLQWQQTIDRLTEQAKMENLQKILRQARQAVRRNYRARFRYLKTACERLITLRI